MDLSPNPDSPPSGGGNGGGGSSSSSSSLSMGAGTPQSPSRYEAQKRRDWNTFGQYLRNHRPPLSLAQCSGAHVLEFLRYLDQFGKTKVHTAATTASAMASAAADGEKPSAHLAHPLLAPPQPPQPYYAYPAAAYASAPPLVLVPAPPVLVRLRRLRPRRISCLRRFSACLLPILLLALLAFLLYPSAPAARVADLRLDRFRVNPPPFPALNLHLALRLLLRNPGLLPIRYRAVSAAVSYRGHLLGSAAARPGSGQLAARGVTYADAEVWVDAGRVLDDVIELIGDLAAGSVPLEIVTEVVGAVRVFRFDIPVKGLISCSVNVSPDTQRVISQDCY